MDQPLDQLAIFPARPTPPASPDAPTAASPAPASQTTVLRRAGNALAGIGARMALVARRIGQPGGSLPGATQPHVPSPDDIRARYLAGLYGAAHLPPSLRDPNRRW